MLCQFMLYEAECITVVLRYVEGVEHKKAIESIAVARSMNFCLDYIEIDVIEETANARE